MSEEAITPEEKTSETQPRKPTPPPPHNAFTALMSPQKPALSSTTSSSRPRSTIDPITQITHHGRNGLGAYIASPTSFPPTRVISYSESFVTIHDLYPKSSIHLLLLPRPPEHTFQHPFAALSVPSFLTSIRSECQTLRTLVAKELRRKYGKFSIQDKAREEAMDLDPPPETLPSGRDWEKEVMVGVHAVPSMNNLHIHILSRDRVSECMRHRKHYNSFNTGFFVPIEDFPLDEHDKRRWPGREGYLQADLRCWRCGRNFKNRFGRLKVHLEEEFEVWKRE